MHGRYEPLAPERRARRRRAIGRQRSSNRAAECGDKAIQGNRRASCKRRNDSWAIARKQPLTERRDGVTRTTDAALTTTRQPEQTLRKTAPAPSGVQVHTVLQPPQAASQSAAQRVASAQIARSEGDQRGSLCTLFWGNRRWGPKTESGFPFL